MMKTNTEPQFPGRKNIAYKRSRIKGEATKAEPLTRKARVDNRNHVMIARYYYWTEIRRLRFDDVMKVLSTQEFFVEDRTISNALLDLSAYLDELYKKKMTAKTLKQCYPGWDWSSN